LAEAALLTIVFNLILYVLQLITWAIILGAIVSTLISFNVLDTRNRFVWGIADFLARINDPLLRPIRRRLPTYSGIDFSPLVLLVLIQMVIIPLLHSLYAGLRYGAWSLWS
jgi:YggT family protein